MAFLQIQYGNKTVTLALKSSSSILLLILLILLLIPFIIFCEYKKFG